MDDLESSARDYCRYTRTKADWISEMVKLVMCEEKFPVYQRDRLRLYAAGGIPETIARDLDYRVLNETIGRMQRAGDDAISQADKEGK
jgi:hypothetical protein